MSDDAPDFTAILDDLFIGNLAAAKSLHERPELGITHILSVCPDYPETATARDSASAPCPSVTHPVHRCVSIQDTEYEDILVHLPSAIAFIREALEPSWTSGKPGGQQTKSDYQDCKQDPELELREDSESFPRQKHKVLVHCVMGISRSTTVVCAYLMATRRLSFPAALMFIRRRRPRVHPNYGFRRQLQIFWDHGCFADYPAPIQTHPAHATWQRKKKREVTKYLSRLDNVVDIRLDDEKEPSVSLTDDFPTDQLEASSLLSEAGATHFLTISPASLPSSLTPPSAAFHVRRPSGLLSPLSPFTSPTSNSTSLPDSAASSPLSSRSSSFSNASRLSSPVSTPSTAATSVLSLPSLLPPSKLRLEVSSSDSDVESENDDESCAEPDYLALAGVEYLHIAVKDSDSSGLLLRMSEAVCFIQQALENASSEFVKESVHADSEDDRQKRVLIHCATESRACAVVCAYLMSCKGLSPHQAYSLLEKAQPLFNPTKSFVTLLEIFHDCDYRPSSDHPRVQAWLAGSSKPHTARSHRSSNTPNDSGTSIRARRVTCQNDTDSEAEDSVSLHRKIGTPVRCGSFSNAYLQQTATDNTTQEHSNHYASNANASRHAAHGGLDVDVLLKRFQGVGDPNFAFDVEAFRGALKGIAADEEEKKTGRARCPR